MAFYTMPADAETYVGGACAIALTPKRSFCSLIPASRNAVMAGSVSDMTLNAGYPSRFSASTVSLIAAWPSTPSHCASMFSDRHERLDFHHSKRSGSLVISLSPFCVGSCPPVKNPWSNAYHKKTALFPLAAVCERLTALRHQPKHDTNRDTDRDRMPRVCSNLLIRRLHRLDFRLACNWFSLGVVSVFLSMVPMIVRLVLQVCVLPHHRMCRLWCSRHLFDDLRPILSCVRLAPSVLSDSLSP